MSSGKSIHAGTNSFTVAIEPWLLVRDGTRAVAYYQSAFDAREVYHIEDPDGKIVSKLLVEGAGFWVADESPSHQNFSPGTPGGSIRIILIVADPDAVFARALQAGAREVYPVSEGHGWRLGRLEDPFGHHWEIGRPLS